MFDLEEVEIILEYLEQFVLDCEIDYKKALYLLQMMKTVDPDGDRQNDEQETEYCRKYYEDVKTVVTMVRNRYESWTRLQENEPPF